MKERLDKCEEEGGEGLGGLGGMGFFEYKRLMLSR